MDNLWWHPQGSGELDKQRGGSLQGPKVAQLGWTGAPTMARRAAVWRRCEAVLGRMK